MHAGANLRAREVRTTGTPGLSGPTSRSDLTNRSVVRTLAGNALAIRGRGIRFGNGCAPTIRIMAAGADLARQSAHACTDLASRSAVCASQRTVARVLLATCGRRRSSGNMRLRSEASDRKEAADSKGMLAAEAVVAKAVVDTQQAAGTTGAVSLRFRFV